jgi:hypothetical protein
MKEYSLYMSRGGETLLDSRSTSWARTKKDFEFLCKEETADREVCILVGVVSGEFSSTILGSKSRYQTRVELEARYFESRPQ